MSQQLGRPSIFDIFIRRPVLSIVISAVLVIIGLRAATGLPVLQYPKIESSSLVITTSYVGASADMVQGFITDPIERAAASVPGVDYIDSNTLPGLSKVTVWLKLNQNSTLALAELTARLQQIRFELPVGAEDPAVRVQRADRQGAAFYLTVASGAMSRGEITDYLQKHVNPRLASITGVQRVGFEGGRLPAMRLWLDPSRMAAFNVSAIDVAAALLRNNVIATVGRSENAQQRIDLLANTTMRSVDDFEQLIISADGSNSSAVVRIRDVARVELGEEEGDVTARLTQQDMVYLSVWPLPGANEIAIGDELYVMLDEINKFDKAAVLKINYTKK